MTRGYRRSGDLTRLASAPAAHLDYLSTDYELLKTADRLRMPRVVGGSIITQLKSRHDLSPGDRISKIQAIGRILEDWSLIDIDLALDNFDAIVRRFAGEEWVQRDKYEYVLQRLSRSDDSALIGLHAHLYEGMAPDDAVAVLPATGEPLVFISHTSKHKSVASEISTEFAEMGIKGFVAHEDIEPTKDWATEIERNLYSCSALLALLTDDFRSSAFCDQEVGYALGRSRVVVAVMQDGSPPHGLASKYQAVGGSSGWNAGRQIAHHVLDVLLGQSTTRPLMTKAAVLLYARSKSFDAARGNLSQLRSLGADEWTEEMMDIAERGGLENDQLSQGLSHLAGNRPIPEVLAGHLDQLLNRSTKDRLAARFRVDLDKASTGVAEDEIPF